MRPGIFTRLWRWLFGEPAAKCPACLAGQHPSVANSPYAYCRLGHCFNHCREWKYAEEIASHEATRREMRIQWRAT